MYPVFRHQQPGAHGSGELKLSNLARMAVVGSNSLLLPRAGCRGSSRPPTQELPCPACLRAGFDIAPPPYFGDSLQVAVVTSALSWPCMLRPDCLGSPPRPNRDGPDGGA